MAVLAHRHRRTVYEKLSPILGDEETDAVLAHFPSTPGEEPVTAAQLDLRLTPMERRLEKAMLTLPAKTLTWIITALVGGLAVGMGAAAAVGQALGG